MNIGGKGNKGIILHKLIVTAGFKGEAHGNELERDFFACVFTYHCLFFCENCMKA